MKRIVLIHSNLSPLSPVLCRFFELVHYEQQKFPSKFNIDPAKMDGFSNSNLLETRGPMSLVRRW